MYLSYITYNEYNITLGVCILYLICPYNNMRRVVLNNIHFIEKDFEAQKVLYIVQESGKAGM